MSRLGSDTFFLAECGYQFCLIDPEGDYEEVAGAVVLGDGERAPSVTEIVQLLRHPAENALVKLYGLPLADRPAFFANLLLKLQELRQAAGRPHWIWSTRSTTSCLAPGILLTCRRRMPSPP